MKAGRFLWQGAFLTATAFAALTSGPALADPVAGSSETGEVIVRYAPGTTGDERIEARDAAGVAFEDKSLLPRVQIVDPDPGRSVTEAIAGLESDPNVLYAEPDRMVELNATPDDTLLPMQWGLLNAGQLVNGTGGTPGADLDAKAGWDIGRTSANTVTAVIDSGITPDHPDLINQVWTNPGETPGNGVDDDNNGFVDDVHGWDFVSGDNDPTDGSRHGTHVAGIIGATGNNDFMVTGVSWDANLMPVRACASVGGCPLSATINGIVYAARMGAKVANMSLGGPNFSQAQRDAIAFGNGTLFVVSAGNNANDTPAVPDQGNNDLIPQYPCMADQAPGNPPLANVICVASTDQDDLKSGFSNWGATSVDLAAPGSNIVSTVPAFINPFADTFEPAADVRWNYAKIDLGNTPTAGGWERNAGLGNEGGSDHGVTDSYGTPYLPNSNAAMTMTGAGVDLSGREACALIYQASVDTERPSPNNFTGADVVFVEASREAGGPWTVIDRLAGNSGGYKSSANLDSDASLDAFAGDSSVFLRYRLQADGDVNVGQGVYIDDVVVRCARSTPGSGNFNYLDGTSMSAPQVSGIASIVRELNPGLFPAEVKAKILGGVDVLPAFSGASPTPLVTGGRANLRKTLGSLDLSAPPAPTLGEPSGVVTNPRPRFSWSATEAGATYRLILDGNVVFTSSGQTEFVPLDDLGLGPHTWSVRVSDRPGNVAESEQKQFTFAPDGAVQVLSARPIKDRRGGVKLRIAVNAAGSVSARATAKVKAGKRKRKKTVGQAKATPTAASTIVVKLRPNAAGRKALRRGRALKSTVSVTFAPALGGKPAGAKRFAKLGPPVKKRRR